MTNRVKLNTTIDGLKAQAEELLIDMGFPSNRRYLQIVGGYIQSLPQSEDFLYKDSLSAYIRRQELNEAAFFLLNPAMYKKLKEQEAKENEAKQQGIQEPAPKMDAEAGE